MHEDPQMPNYGKRGRGKKFKEGLVVASCGWNLAIASMSPVSATTVVICFNCSSWESEFVMAVPKHFAKNKKRWI